MKKLPGTTLEILSIDSRKIFNSLFSTGGLVLSQVCSITGLETHIVQNWVKRKFVPPAKDKKYSKNQLCRIITINMLRETMSIDHICALIGYINGVLEDEADDLISDSELYFYFVDLVLINDNNMENIDANLDLALMNYNEPVVGTRRKLKNVLKVMFTAYLSAEYKRKTYLNFKILGVD